MKFEDRIIGVCPTPSHLRINAVYTDPDDGKEEIEPVVCFALVRNKNGFTDIIPMTLDIEGVVDDPTEATNFLRMDVEERSTP